MAQATELIGKCELGRGGGGQTGESDRQLWTFIFSEEKGHLGRKQMFLRTPCLLFKFSSKMLSRQLAQVESESRNSEGQSGIIGTQLKDTLRIIQRRLIFQMLLT